MGRRLGSLRTEAFLAGSRVRVGLWEFYFEFVMFEMSNRLLSANVKKANKHVNLIFREVLKNI